MNNFGMQAKSAENRQAKEKEIERLTQAKYDAMLSEIKEKTEGKDEYIPVIANNMNFSDNKSNDRLARPYLMYRLQSNPNLISKLKTKMNGKKLAEKMQPYAFKWVNAEDKIRLGFQGIAMKGIEEKHIDFLVGKIKNIKSAPIDVLKCFAQLLADHADKNWITLDILKATSRSMMPIENYIKAIQDLIDNEVVIIGTYQETHTYRNGKEYQVNQYAVTIAYDPVIEQKRKNESVNANLIYQLIHEHQDLITSQKKSRSKRKKLKENFALPDTKNITQTVAIKPEVVDVNTNNIADNDIEFGKMILAQISTYVEQRMAKSKEEHDQALFERNKFANIVERLNSENEVLRKKIERNELSDKKSKEQLAKVKAERNAYRDFSDMFAMNAQDNLDLLLHKVIKAAETFAERPRYEKSNEMVVAKFTKEINTIIMTISKNITSYTPESKFPPAMK